MEVEISKKMFKMYKNIQNSSVNVWFITKSSNDLQTIFY